ncbi:MAG TPA: tetratricopeptide repeat protein [Chitinophagaceae bacterium]|nr:tetratricopeptide repeat protein [Chitinophagaceae bacterium]
MAWLKYLLFFSINLVASTSFAEKVFDFNANCRQAYNEIVKLKLTSGQQLLNEEKEANPENLIPYFLENYIDFFELFFNEDPLTYKSRLLNRSKRLNLMDEGPSNSPFLRFTKAIINFQWATIKIKFGNRWDAGWEFRRSYLQIKDNKERFPDFLPNDMLYGAMQTVVGTVPDGYKWIGKLLGLNGSIKTGINLLQQFLNSSNEWATVFRVEGIFYYSYLRFHVLNEREEIFEYVRLQKLDLVNNHLFAYMMANLAINNKQSHFAQQIIQQRNPAGDYLVTPVWDMEMGFAKLNHLDKDASTYLLRFVRLFKGKFYVKEALQKLSWYYYLSGDKETATYYQQMAKTKGNAVTEADKYALKEAKLGKWPNLLLLKARLLSDGGYQQEALSVLAGKSETDFKEVVERVEFAYRLGRIYDDMRLYEDAIRFYLTTVKTGEKLKEYYAARAAIQIGNIYEKRGQRNQAITFYEKCLSMGDHDYKDSLDQKAKAGIARCKGE